MRGAVESAAVAARMADGAVSKRPTAVLGWAPNIGSAACLKQDAIFAGLVYDGTGKQIDAQILLAGSPMTPTGPRSILDKVAIENLRQIISKERQPILKSP